MKGNLGKRTVLFWTTYSGFERVRRIELELIHRERARGSTIVGVYCAGALPRCHAFRKGRREYFECAICTASYAAHVVPLIDRLVELSPDWMVGDLSSDIRSHDRLKAVFHDGSDIGTAVLSTMMTNATDAKVELAGRHPEIKAQYTAGVMVHDQLARALDEISPDAVYFFNGRHFDSRPLLRLCQRRGIDFYTYECAVRPDHFRLLRRTTPHDSTHFKTEFRSQAMTASEADLNQIREEIASGSDIYGEGYRRSQVPGRLPDDFDHNQSNIAILHSSEDEYAADGLIRFWWGKDFEETFGSILDKIGNQKQLRFYLRIHPRLASVASSEFDRLMRIQHPQLVIVPPDSPVNTFALALAATACITYGSTAGIEAAMLGARVLCIADCWYNDLDIVPDVRDIEKLQFLLTNPQEISCDPRAAAAYISYVRNQGEAFSRPDLQGDSDQLVPAAKVSFCVRRLFLRLGIPFSRLAIDRLYFALANRILSPLMSRKPK
jgi:hypothetical protein